MFEKNRMALGLLFCMLLYSSNSMCNLFSLTQYHSGNGLPQNSIRAMVQDKQGLIWIGTETGLVRFDGIRFKQILAPEGKTVVSQLQVDNKNRIWVKWFDFAPDIYDPKTNLWKELPYINKEKNFAYIGFQEINGVNWLFGNRQPLAFINSDDEYVVLNHSVNRYLYNFKEDYNIYGFQWLNNHLLVLLNRGLLKISLENDSFEFYENITFTSRMKSFISIDNEGYFCTPNGFYYLDANSLKPILIYEIQNKLVQCELFGEKIVILSQQNSVYVFDIKNATFENLQEKFQHIDFTKVKTIKTTRLGLFLVLNAESIFIKNGKVSHVPFKNPNLIKSYISNVLETNDGNIFFGSDASGLFKISAKSKKFDTIKPPQSMSGLFRKAVSLGNELWLASDVLGVVRWDRKTDEWKQYSTKQNTDYLDYDQVRAISKDNNGQIWAVQVHGKLYRYRSDRDEFELVLALENKNSNVMITDQDNLFIGSSEYVYNYDLTSSTIRELSINKPHLMGKQIKALIKTKDDNLLIGTHYGGVKKVSLNGEVIKAWDETILSSRNVFSLYEDGLGYIWVGTWGGGLNRINPTNDEVQVFNINSGLADNTIFGILPGQNGELWLSSYNGLTQLKECVSHAWPCEPIIRHYTEQDGLQGKEFDAESFALLDTGELYFAGNNGFNIFYPQDLPVNERTPDMLLTDVAIDGQWQYPISEHIELNHNFTNLVLEFVALDYQNPKANKYQYKPSQTDEWIDLDTPRIQFSRLKSGTHQLQIRGSNNDGVWTDEPLSIKVYVKPPWYLSWIALIAYAMLIAVSVMYWVNRREIFLKRQTKILEKKVKSRTKKLRLAYENQNKIYSSISHTTRTPLTNLLNPLNELKAGKAFKPEWTDMMIRQGEQLKNNIQNLIDISRLQSGENIRWGAHELAPLLKSLQQDFQLQADRKHIELLVDDQTSKHAAVKSYEQSLTIIMNNLLENAIKQTPENGHITITASEQKAHVVITVKDTGPGIKQEEIEQIFKYGQSNYKKSGWQPASGIGLYTCANVAKALNGVLSTKNSVQGGAVFTLKLPKADSSTKNRIEVRKSDKYTQRKSPQKIINSKNAEKPQILLLDDNPDILCTLSDQLQNHYQIITSTDVEKALAIIAEQIPDLIISDVMMPQMNGFEFLQRIRSNSLTEDCPVIMLTAMDEKTAQLQSLQLKADTVISKPHDKERLLLTIENLLLKRTQAYFKAQLEFENYLLKKVESQKPTNNIYQQIIEYLEENYHKTDLNVECLARALGKSAATLSRKLKKITHTKPLEIINTVRIKKAKHLIKQGADFIKVAYDCGFSSQQAFNRIFKKVTKQTPNQYKKSLYVKN